MTYDSELTNESREGDRLVSLPLLVLPVSVYSVLQYDKGKCRIGIDGFGD